MPPDKLIDMARYSWCEPDLIRPGKVQYEPCPPASPTMAQAGHVSVGGALAVWCAAGDQQSITVLREPVVPTEVVQP